MNEWDEIGWNPPAKAPAKPIPPRRALPSRWGWNSDHRRMVEDHRDEFNSMVEYEIERLRGGE